MQHFYTTKEASEYLGISVHSLYNLINDGKLQVAKISRFLIVLPEELEKTKRMYYASGLTENEIATIYGKSRTTVRKEFTERLHVRPTGVNRRKRGAKIYDPDTVEKFAKILGWEPVQSTSKSAI